ncbi:MAG: helix-turn-helix domain-containing protein [Planctomycetota bacterium JB042]
MVNGQNLSPKQLAQAIGASESSVKRWVDDGSIPAFKTAGGHRKIALRDALSFIRTRGLNVEQPEVLGMAEVADWARSPSDRSSEHLFRLLEQGHRNRARGLLLSLYLEGESLAALFDGPMREALVRIGELWRDREDGVFVEHRATAICLEVLHRLNLDFLAVPPGGPVAVGGACAGDQSSLPTLMAALVVRAEGFHDVNLGPNTPADSLLRAVDRYGARIAWWSANHVEDREGASDELRALVAETENRDVTLVLGGRVVRALEPPEAKHVYVADRMGELAALARGMMNGQPG